ncbi:MAG TPA: hypothetical protein VII56_20260 [Rhizomicrobium sp.]
MSGKTDEPDLERQRVQAEIDKLRAETDVLLRRPGFVERNWVPLLTVIAATVGGLGGLAALLNVFVQIHSLPYTDVRSELDARTKAIEAIKLRDELSAEADNLKSGNAVLVKTIKDRMALSGSLQANITKLKNQLASAREQLAHTHSELIDVSSVLHLSGQAALANRVSLLVAGSAPPAGQDQLAPGLLAYVFYQDGPSHDAISGLKTYLVKHQITTASAEQLSPDNWRLFHPDQVRYFHREDKDKAEQVAVLVNDYLTSQCPSHPDVPAALHDADADGSTPPGDFEIWIGFECRKQPVAN